MELWSQILSRHSVRNGVFAGVKWRSFSKSGRACNQKTHKMTQKCQILSFLGKWHGVLNSNFHERVTVWRTSIGINRIAYLMVVRGCKQKTLKMNQKWSNILSFARETCLLWISSFLSQFFTVNIFSKDKGDLERRGD